MNASSDRRLRELFSAKQAEMLTRLRGSRQVLEHPGTSGAATESGWRSLVESYLPTRYKVDDGFVLDSEGNVSQQIDLLILDRQYSPVLFETEGQRYFPAESVYGVFEIKQEMSKENVDYAAGKIASVRDLHRTSVAITHAGGTFPARSPIDILGGILTTESSWSPTFGTPFDSAINSQIPAGRIDLGCVLANGSFVADFELGQPTIHTHDPKLSLVSFVFELLSKLQQVGTVPAMDYRKYLNSATIEDTSI